MDARHEVAAQERGEGFRVDAVVLDLGVRDDAVLRRVRAHDLGNAGRVLEQVVEHAPVPAGLDDDFAGRAEFLEVGGKSRGDVAVDPRFVELLALRVERAGHRVTFVIIDSSGDHGGKVGHRAARMALL